MTLPISPVTLPADLVGQPNGRIAGELLVDIGPSGLLHHAAARTHRALVAAAAEAGFQLTYTYGGTYRTLAAQTVLFESRYSPTGTGGGCKFYKGQQWCKKSANLATAAVPSTSNHGLGLAVDFALGDNPSNAKSLTQPAVDWLIANAHRFGWSAELQSEKWHWRHVVGDAIPQAVLDYEQPTQPTPQGDPDMIMLDYTNPATGQWTALTFTGTHLAHTEGHADEIIRTVPAIVRRPINDAQLDAFIESAATTTPPPPEFSAGRQAAWNARRG